MSAPDTGPPAPASPPLTWFSDDQPTPPASGLLGWCLVVLRGVPLVGLLLLGLGVTLVLRPVERLASGTGRPLTGWVTVAVCRGALLLLRLRVRRFGRPMRGAGVVVANHSSWLDIFVLNAGGPMYFVSKAEVSGWAGIGWLARATGTVFIRRSRAEARAHVSDVADRLSAGHRLTLFAEGTSSDGARVLPFKPTLFEALLQGAKARGGKSGTGLAAQPVTVRYTAPQGRDARFYGWWGSMDFAPYARAVLSQWPQGRVTVIYGDPIDVTEHDDRKRLAHILETAVRDGFDQAIIKRD